MFDLQYAFESALLVWYNYQLYFDTVDVQPSSTFFFFFLFFFFFSFLSDLTVSCYLRNHIMF